MLKPLLTVEAAFHIKVRNGVVVSPSLPADFLKERKRSTFKGFLIFPDGQRQEVNGRFITVHYSGRPIGLPSWSIECFLEEISAVPAGTEIWWNEVEGKSS